MEFPNGLSACFGLVYLAPARRLQNVWSSFNAQRKVDRTSAGAVDFQVNFCRYVIKKHEVYVLECGKDVLHRLSYLVHV